MKWKKLKVALRFALDNRYSHRMRVPRNSRASAFILEFRNALHNALIAVLFAAHVPGRNDSQQVPGSPKLQIVVESVDQIKESASAFERSRSRRKCRLKCYRSWRAFSQSLLKSSFPAGPIIASIFCFRINSVKALWIASVLVRDPVNRTASSSNSSRICSMLSSWAILINIFDTYDMIEMVHMAISALTGGGVR